MAEQQLIVQRSLEGMGETQYLVALMEMINVMNPVEARAKTHGETVEFFIEEDKAAIAHVEQAFSVPALGPMQAAFAAEVVELFEQCVDTYGFDLRQLNADGVEAEDGNSVVTIEVWGVPLV